MKFFSVFASGLLYCCVGVLAAGAQDKGPWRAAGSTAKSITGDIAIGDTRLVINFASFPLAPVRALSAAEASAAFDADPGTPGGGNLYRLQVAPDRRFQHHNTLCGTDQTQWMATWASGRDLKVAFFSGQKMPLLTLDALNESSTLCGTFDYAR